MSLKGKTAVITGGTRGIGLATARNFLKEGVINVVLLDICENEENVQQLKDEFGKANIVLMLTDVTKRDDVEQTFNKILKLIQQIDIVVNCAGICCDKDIERTIAVNLIGVINTSLAAMNVMSASNGGKGGIIVNVASVTALAKSPLLPIYFASKHGVLGFTRSMAHDIHYAKHSVKFIVVCPAVTDTLCATPPKENFLFPECSNFRTKFRSVVGCQTADECGRNIALITATASNGAIWIIDNGESEEVFMPKLWKMELEYFK